jgi:hypothetical protein
MEFPKTFLEWVTLIGAILGIIAFAIDAKDIWEWIAGYVAVSLEISDNKGRIAVETAVENKSVWRKKIDWAFLVISPRDKNFLTSLRSKTTRSLESTNDLIHLKMDQIISEDGVTLQPLTFFYRENIAVRDEKITYTEILDAFSDGVYDVRFFVFPKSIRHGLHRCNHAAFIIKQGA